MNKLLATLVVAVAIYFGYSFLAKENDVLVKIPDGKLMGNVMVDRKGGEFYAFQGIPYAQAPVGDLRFKPPQPLKPWLGVLDATRDFPVCKQIEFGKILGVEDCLHLNVYTKNIKPSEDLKPVMVYIHGGSFYEGSGSITKYGPHNLITEDIVLVTINYRLGVLGFLSLEGSSDISSNNGLKDQVQALKWVQKNIKYFGGNAKSVTIFGESAGGASVHLHMLSPLSKGLFHRVIAQSGTALNNWSFGIKNSALPLAKYLGVDTTDVQAIGKELRKFSVEEIFDAQQNIDWVLKVQPWLGSPIPEGNVPGAFLPDLPENIIKSGNYNKVPLMLGYTNREAIILALFHELSGSKYQPNLANDLPYDYTRGNQAKIDVGVEKVKEFYYKNKLPEAITTDVIDFLTDAWFSYSIIKTARYHSTTIPVFLYEFSADTKMNFFKRMNKVTAKIPGSSHVDDLGYLFRNEISEAIVPGSLEDVVVERVVKLWTNFAKFGKPTPEKCETLQNLVWLPVEKDRLNFMNISNSLEFGEIKSKRLEFWDQLYRQ